MSPVVGFDDEPTSHACDIGTHEGCRMRGCTCACHRRLAIVERTAPPKRDDDGLWSPYLKRRRKP